MYCVDITTAPAACESSECYCPFLVGPSLSPRAAVTLAIILPLTLNYLRAGLGDALRCGVMTIGSFSPFQACQPAHRE